MLDGDALGTHSPGEHRSLCRERMTDLGDFLNQRELCLFIFTGKTLQLNMTTSGSLLLGELYELTCNATDPMVGFLGLPKIYWTRDGANVTTDSSQGFEIGEAVEADDSVRRSLILFPVRQSHAGQYRCVAVQPEETAYVEETVEVLGKRWHNLRNDCVLCFSYAFWLSWN